MSDHQFDPATGTFKDTQGTQYQTPDNNPPSAGSTVRSYQNGQAQEGTIQNGVFVPNNK